MVRVLKWVGRSLMIGVLWVFLLSIQWKGEPIFNQLNDKLVKNPLVTSLDQEMADFFGRLKKAVQLAWATSPQSAKEHLE